MSQAERYTTLQAPEEVRQAWAKENIDLDQTDADISTKQLIDLLPLSPGAIEFGKHMIGREVIEAALLGKRHAGQAVTGLDALSTDTNLAVEVSRRDINNCIGRSTVFIDDGYRGGLPEAVISYLGKIGEYNRANDHAIETDILKKLPAW